MNIIIRNTGGQPIYEQIAGQIKALIISGELQEGDMLPSMQLAGKGLRISVYNKTGLRGTGTGRIYYISNRERQLCGGKKSGSGAGSTAAEN